MKYETIYFVRKLDDPDSPRVRNVLNDINGVLKLEDITGQDDKINDKTLIVTIGGDGTAIQGMKLSAQSQGHVMCFNLGRIGFLADYEPNRVFESVSSLFNNYTRYEERTLLEGTTAEDDQALAVNDIVVSRLYADEMLVYDLFVDGAFAGNHRANGVIVSTPTGSTAYALSAGGAILHPTVECIQIVPVAAATMTSRPIIVSAQSEIKIKVDVKAMRGESKQVVVRADGQVTSLGLGDTIEDREKTSHTVTINAFNNKAVVLHQAHWNYFDVLTQKLYWNK